jgi:hypothetical protein
MNEFIGFQEFSAQFFTEDECRKFLCEWKWERGFTCQKCGHPSCIKGRTWYYRKCQRCQFDESCTAFTMFHKLKFPLDKAFQITYSIAFCDSTITPSEISSHYGIHQETAWKFKKKVISMLELNQIPFGVREREVGGGETKI